MTRHTTMRYMKPLLVLSSAALFVVLLLVMFLGMGKRPADNPRSSHSFPQMNATETTSGDKPTSAGPTPAAPKTVPDNALQTTRLYLIRVIDATSNAPIHKARIKVELIIPSKTNWTGVTDSRGFFQFEWDAIPRSVKTHMSVQASGFSSLDEYSLLLPDKLITLNRATGH